MSVLHDMIRAERAFKVAAMHLWLGIRLVDFVYWLNHRLGGSATSPYRRRGPR